MVYPRVYGPYVLLERIGTGGMSEIDLARRAVEDANFLRFLVIKRIKAERSDDESIIRMFKDEARISSELHHGNVALVYDFGRQVDEYYLVLEYIPGMDARRILNLSRATNRSIPMRIILRILCDVLAGLHYAHTRRDSLGQPMNIVHRDVNPRNIMVSRHGEVKLIDFGVAKATGRLERTRTDHVKGKFAYMAPEQMAAQEVDARADLFAAAITLHELVAQKGAFHGLNQVQIMHRMVNGILPELPLHRDLQDPTDLRTTQRRGLAVNRDERYPDCETYREALLRVAQPIGGLATEKELAAYLVELDPLLETRLNDLISRFSGPLEFSPTDGESEAEVTIGTAETVINPTPPPRADTSVSTSHPALPASRGESIVRLVTFGGFLLAGGAIVLTVAVLAAAVIWLN